MNMIQRNKVYFIMTGLNESFQKTATVSVMNTDAQEVINDALHILEKENVLQNRAIDYALARLYSRFVRLIGLQGMKLSPEADQWWQQLKDFMKNDIHEELSQVGGPQFIT
ncbi:hypothetical protein [Lacticaseibacillus paracasei]|uniref:hypothetical protein n=1 Tax=Lacticaseibacillus paracasei TaxID=1597 RepID=UPI0031D7876A